MYAARLIMFCLLSLSICITCQAATFEKVSSSFSLFRDVHLQCAPSDVGSLDSYMNETVDDFDANSASWGYTPIMKTRTSYLMSLDSAENAETAMYYDPPGGGNDAAVRVALDGSDPYHNRVRTAAFHRPVFTFWQPGWYEPHTYGIDLSVRTEATAFYRIAPLGGETVGDEITLTVEGGTEHEENWGGPNAFSGHLNYLTNIATRPGFIMNPANGGIWRTIDGAASFTARIGDIIGMRTTVESSVGPIEGGIPSWPSVDNYLALGLFASSSINVSLPLPVPPGLPGDINADEAVNLVDAILGFQVVSGLTPAGIRSGTGADVNGDKRIGLEEVIYVVQTLAGLRQN